MDTRIGIPERAAARVMGALAAVEQAKAQLTAAVQLVADALDVPEGWTVEGDASGLFFVPPAGTGVAAGDGQETGQG